MRLSFLILPILLFTVDASAQQRTVTLDDALHMADEASFEIRRLRLSVERVAADVEGVNEEYGPDIFASAEYSLSPQPQILFVNPDVSFNTTGEMDALVIGGHHIVSASIAARQPLYDPRRRLRLRLAESGVGVAEAELEVARATLRRNVERLFYRVLFARIEKKTREDLIKQGVANLDFTLARFRQGRALPLDTVTAAAALARAKADAHRAALGYQAALLQLARRIGIADAQTIELDGSLEIPTAPGPSGGDMTITPGFPGSARLRLAEKRLEASGIALESEERITAPTIDLVGNVRGAAQGDGYVPDQWAWGMTSFVGLVAGMSISQVWRGDPRREAARIRIRENQLAILEIKHEDSIAVETVLFDMQAVRAQIDAEEATLEQSRKAIEITTILYREGRATWLDVETAQNRLLETELVLERLKLRFLEDYAELKAIAG